MSRSGRVDGEITDAAAMASSPSHDRSSRQATRHDRPGILVVDDDQTILGVIDAFLAGSDDRVFLASSGLQALDVLRQCGGAIDLLLIDVQMPDIHGPELSDQVVRRYPGVRVLFMSCFNAAPGAWYGLSLSAPLLVKPFGVSELRQRVRQVLSGRVPSRARATFSQLDALSHRVI